jgi:DNA helicase-2/ATP-dependent DNA helicase PcrA
MARRREDEAERDAFATPSSGYEGHEVEESGTSDRAWGGVCTTDVDRDSTQAGNTGNIGTNGGSSSSEGLFSPANNEVAEDDLLGAHPGSFFKNSELGTTARGAGIIGHKKPYQNGQENSPATGAPVAVPGPEGEFHLLGPPGTGKTTALTQKWIPRAIARYGPKAVAVCSLTRTAAAELASRQVVALPRERVGTLHSFARRALADVLGKPELAQIAENVERWNEEIAGGRPELRLSGSSNGALDAPKASAGGSSGFTPEDRRRAARASQRAAPTGDEIMADIEVLRHRMVPVDDWPSGLLPLWQAWQAWKHEEQLFDFTDLISVALENGTAPPLLDGVAVEALFVDEAQDFSALEMALVRSWQEHVHVCVLSGDPNQSIFGFRGAEAHAFHDAASFSAKRTYVLGQSYRLPKNVQAKAEAWLTTASSSTPLSYKPRESDDAGAVERVPDTMVARHAGSLASQVASELKRLEPMEGDHNRVMVLASAAYILKPILAELRRRRILYCNPFQADRGDWNPLKTSQRHIVTLFVGPCPYLTGEDGPGGREPRLWSWSELKQWTDVLQAKGLLMHGAKANIIAREAKKRGRVIMDHGDLERVFVDAASIRADILPMIRDPKRVAETLNWLRDQMTASHARRLSFVLDVARHDIRQIMAPPRVVIGTIHSVKGGTAGTVFLSPDISRKHEEERRRSPEGFDGIIRLFSVGMTRASSKLVLLSPTRRGQRLTPHVQW